MAQKDFFSLLNQPQQFAVDSLSLEQAKNTLLARLHPDRFVNASALEKRLAEQMSVRVNEAYQTLTDDLKRARYLCQLHGLDVNAHRPMPADFLMKQMQWHEMLETAKATHDDRTREALMQKVLEEKEALLMSLTEAFDVKGDYNEAFDLTRKFMFISKLLAKISI